MTDDSDERKGKVHVLPVTGGDPVLQLASALTAVIGNAPRTMTSAQTVAAIRLATDAYAMLLRQGAEPYNTVVLAGLEIAKRYSFTEEHAKHVHDQIVASRPSGPVADVIPLFRRKDEEKP